MDRQRSESRIADVIRSLSADIVALQELDHGRARSARVDQAGVIAEQLGWHRFFHPAMRVAEEHYGDAIVSRYPIIVRREGELPGKAPWYCRETRGAVWVEAETNLGTVHMINTHLGLGRSERILQAQLLTGADWLGAVPDGAPTILLGDFNTVPLSLTYRLLTKQLRDVRTLVASRRSFRTFPTKFPAVTVDYIFVNDALRPVNVEVHRSVLARVASDHYPLVADLVLANG